ncbi:uncharacterized protein LOC135090163 isoform X1 [Scylla paramamosain]|uniref:uncharacterized protein LOC135090163 isoform X1 n=1 Tax=Scylla paramamosain TaxID=85552 RepID=UPI003083BB91
MATLRSCKQVGGSDGGGGGSGGEVEGRDRGAVQAADIKEKKNTRTSKVVFGSLILDLLAFTVVLPLSPALLDYYSKHDSSGLYSSLLSCVTYYQHIIGVPARAMATLRSCKQVGGSDGGGGGSGGEVEGRDRGAVQAADIKEKKNTRTSKVVFGSLILDLLGFTVVLPLSPALLDYYSKHDSSGLYSSLLSCVTYYQHIIGVPARFHSVLFGGTDRRGIQRRLHHQANCGGRVLPLVKYWVVRGLSCLHTHSCCG